MSENYHYAYQPGPPPCVGWWPASLHGQTKDCYRYWDGTKWSFAGRQFNTSAQAAKIARDRSFHSGVIKWRYFYPEETEVILAPVFYYGVGLVYTEKSQY